MTRQDPESRNVAAIALVTPFKLRRGKCAFEVLDDAKRTCERIAVRRLIADDVGEAKAWARASVLLNDRLKRTMR